MLKTITTSAFILLSALAFSQSLNRSKVSFFSGENTITKTSLNGSSYSVNNFSDQQILISGFQQPDSLGFVLEVAANDLKEFRIYPNPFTSEIVLNTSVKGYSVEIVNVVGESIYKSTGNEVKRIKLEGFPAGIYLLRIKVRDNFTTVKLIHE